ncbi:MAG: ABC transporter ATP-binding protein/permease [Bacteroidales bacterium]|nr:ABC transporter ATP-binding protein/permease [Bacteroidales bacterium]
MLKTLFSLVGKYKKATILTPIIVSFEVIIDVLIPYVTASLIDKGINIGNIQNVYFYGALMVLMAFLSLGAGILAGRNSAYASTGFAFNLRSAMYKNIQTFSFADIDKFSTASLVTRMTADTSNLQRTFQMLMRITVKAPFTLIFSIIMCFIINAKLSIIFVIALALLSGFLIFILKRVSKIFQQVFQKYDDLNANIEENVSAIREVKAFVREDFENQKFSKTSIALYKLYVKAESLMATNGPFMNMIVYACIIALSWWGAKFIVAGQLTTGQLTSLLAYIMSILGSLMMLSMVFVNLSMSQASGKRVTEVLNHKPEIKEDNDCITEISDGSISFKNVDFAYSGSTNNSLSNINLDIKSGETIGIIGGNGSGKSTLVNLISRLYDVSSGELLVGGINVKKYNKTVLRSNVAVVLQNNILFAGTILENLRWGKSDATIEECQKACKLAAADEFILNMQDGYNSMLNTNASNISGGQKQRLCIARALLKKPKILILDDSTSACDAVTDKKIREALKNNIPNVTKLIIAQRVSSIKDCNKILVLENGNISGFDTHDNLMKTNKIYSEIAELQANAGADFDKPE